ncbi:MAG: hypothetical protein Kow0037_25290 [Calditrichia bacterium]
MSPTELEKRVFDDILQINAATELRDVLARYQLPAVMNEKGQQSGKLQSFHFNLSGLLALQQGIPHLYIEILDRLKEGLQSLLNRQLPEIFLRFHKGNGSGYSVIYGKKVWLVQLPLYFSTIRPDFFKLLGCTIAARLENYRLPDHLLKEIQETIRRHHPGHRTTGAWQDPQLLEIFNRLNRQYFKNALTLSNLKWGRGLAVRKLGSYNDVSRTITISRLLKHPRVPHYVLEFVMYHEMLHMKFPIQVVNGRRRIHPPEFKKAEKYFMHFRQAETWLKNDLPGLIREVSKPTPFPFKMKPGF